MKEKEDEQKPEYSALFEIYEAVNSAEKDEAEATPSLWVLPLGSLREIVAEHFELEALSAEVRELVLDLDVDDGEIIVITPGHAGVMGREST